MTDTDFQIDGSWIGNQDALESRVESVPESDREALRVALQYLYLQDGPRSIPRKQKTPAEQHLNVAELFVFQWLYKRTDGKLRRHYGPASLAAAKRSGYRCERCNFADVRALNLEKQDSRTAEPVFACLCANCHTIEARANELAAAAALKKSREPRSWNAADEEAENTQEPS